MIAHIRLFSDVRLPGGPLAEPPKLCWAYSPPCRYRAPLNYVLAWARWFFKVFFVWVPKIDKIWELVGVRLPPREVCCPGHCHWSLGNKGSTSLGSPASWSAMTLNPASLTEKERTECLAGGQYFQSCPTSVCSYRHRVITTQAFLPLLLQNTVLSCK
jgi:hypothetical protein